MKKSLLSRIVPAAFISAALLTAGCLEGNPDYKPPCHTDGNVSSYCGGLGEFCSPSRFCVKANDTANPNYPTRKEGELTLVFPPPGKLIGGNTMIVTRLSNETAEVEFWAIDAQMTHFKLGRNASGVFPWKPSDIKDTTHLFLRSFDAQGNRQQPDSPNIPVIITAK